VSRLFLSHSSVNNAEAVAIRDWLASEGCDDVFLDLDPEHGIKAGERWERALNEAASRCEAVLFLVSPVWLASRWCLKEFNLARKLNKRLFGVLIEAIPIAELPEDLTGTWQIVDLASGQDHAVIQVRMPRTHEEVYITFSREGLARLRNGLWKAGLDPRFFAWPPDVDPIGRPTAALDRWRPKTLASSSAEMRQSSRRSTLCVGCGKARPLECSSSSGPPGQASPHSCVRVFWHALVVMTAIS
jgi:TIR domain-containing protein